MFRVLITVLFAVRAACVRGLPPAKACRPTNLQRIRRRVEFATCTGERSVPAVQRLERLALERQKQSKTNALEALPRGTSNQLGKSSSLDRGRAGHMHSCAVVLLKPAAPSADCYLSALNSSVRRLIFEAAPPMIHMSYTTTAIVIAARIKLTNDTCQKPTK